MHSGLNHRSRVGVIRIGEGRSDCWALRTNGLHFGWSPTSLVTGTEGRDVDGKCRELHRSPARPWDFFRQERWDAPIKYVR